MNDNILIITNSSDLHADILVSRLEKKGVSPFRINLNEFPRDFELTFETRQDSWMAVITHLPSGRELDTHQIKSIWTRKASDFSFLSENDYSAQEKAYANQETKHVLNGILYSVDCFWMNHPLAVRSALWKGEQTIRAAKMGFNIPESLITNRPESVPQFQEMVNRDVVLKSQSTPSLAMEEVAVDDQVVTQGLQTTILTDDHYENIESVREIPCYFQAYIEKQFELRVTVIGNHVFAAKINSQDSEQTKVDFRDYSADILYEAFHLPDDIETRCRDYVHSYNLQYGAMDIIVTPEGEYVFLENNPAGQFWFVEQLVPELKMMNALAECLMNGKP
ncbi:MAG: hypothetical protein R8G66_01375 [Cytophagales bacterium]|nr:hypothetical protein [Cytophagales bacterium]